MWSIAPKPPTCPSRLQPIHQAKSCFDLLHLDHMTQCHVSYAISSFIITCVSFATSPSHFHLHGICCSHACTCGLITCVSHINTISPSRLSLNYQNHTRTFHIARGLPRVSICLDILLARPLLTFKTGDTVCGCKTMSKTGRTARPYAPTAMVFLFTSIIEFIVTHTTSFSSCLLEKGSEGSSYRISFEEKLSGRLNQSNGLDRRRETRNKKWRCLCRLHRPHRKRWTRTPHEHVW